MLIHNPGRAPSKPYFWEGQLVTCKRCDFSATFLEADETKVHIISVKPEGEVVIQIECPTCKYKIRHKFMQEKDK